MSDAIRVNGSMLSWGSTTLRINGQPYTGITSISYADKRERVKAYGMGRSQSPRGRSRGKYTADPVKLKGFKASIQSLRADLATRATDGISYGDVEFPMILQFIENEAQITVEFDQCVWTGNSATDDEGADPLQEEIEIDVMRIKRNGLVLYDASRGVP